MHLTCSRFLLGANFNFDVAKGKFSKYDAGFVTEPVDNLLVGFRHDSANKEELELGKFVVAIQHKASDLNTVGTEYTYDWKTKATNLRFGINHKQNDDSSWKVKVDEKGTLNGVFKTKLNSWATGSITSGLNVKDFATGKTQGSPFGFALDLKL